MTGRAGRQPIRAWVEAAAKGEARGPLAAGWRGALAPASWLYAGAMAIRRRAYGCGLVRVSAAPVPVISVGNVTAGGTGKTPFVEWLARELLAIGRQPAIVSRGYRAGVEDTNDEHRVLAANLADVPHVLDAQRSRGAAAAVDKYGADCIILDDGFQHLALKRDLDLVLVDASRPFGNGMLLPAGVLREPVKQLARAGVVVLSRVDAVSRECLDEVRAAIDLAAPGVPLIECAHAPVALHELASDREESPAWLSGRSIFWFCGIGNPTGFVSTLERLGAHVAGGKAFPDHHRYVAEDLPVLADAAADAGAGVLVTTQKDRVKLHMSDEWRVPTYWLKVAMRIARNEGLLVQAIAATLRQPGEPDT